MGDFPRRYRDCTLDNFKASTPSARAALAQARRFAAGEIGSLVLVGPVGCGKTHLAIAAARTRGPVGEGRSIVGPTWCSVPDLTVGLRLDIGRPYERREWDEELADLRVWRATVVLDDLGQEKVSDWTGEIVYTLVNGRYNDVLPTIATTNMTEEQMVVSPYWSAISRLAQDGALVRIVAPDYRLKGDK